MLGLHLVISAYGFWPPNDPRGSWSSYVRAQQLYDIGGQATKVATTQSPANRRRDQKLRQRIRANLIYPPVTLTGIQARAVARGVTNVCPKIEFFVHALLRYKYAGITIITPPAATPTMNVKFAI